MICCKYLHSFESITPLSCNTCDTSGAPASDDDSDDDEETLCSGDSLGKAIALFKQVRFLLPYELIFRTHAGRTTDS